MATVVWIRRAHEEKDLLYMNGRLEFGVNVANKTAKKIQNIEESLAKHPELGYIEQLLIDKTRYIYRAWQINKRFKIIYRYDETKDIVVIADIWDIRRSPTNLTRRLTK